VKIKLVLALIAIVVICLFPSCDQISQTESDVAKADLAETQAELADVREQLASTQHESDELTVELAALQADYQDVLGRLKQSTLKDPTWAELEEFLKRDDTNELIYDLLSFDCSGFAITLRDRAWIYGFRCGFVEISFLNKSSGHALNVFQTTDKGLIYVDDTEHDKIAYVQLGERYDTISLDAVKSEYINCDGSPTMFWGPLTWSTHPALFSYDYYINYQKRYEFYRESTDAYNVAVREYNAGSKEYSHVQMTSWLEHLEALKLDVGSVSYEPMEIVGNIEVYWN
jgi:hypothetical protein